jgi:hypothetical protein
MVKMMHKFESNRLSGWTILAMFLFQTLHNAPVWASDDDLHVTDGVTTETPIDASGLRVYRDPTSGRLVPPPAGFFQPPGLSIAEQQMLNRSEKGLRAHTLPNGAVAIDLQGRFRSMAVATTGTVGKPAVNCTHTLSETNAILQRAVENKKIE